ncbi:helix-turn-helix domain-containing protein [Paraclostridium sordellii]|uniref:helix-turn-helix domain-containing protein n=2 Tax=Paraclostridium sordellii TaxID=1505 RepID=UPI0005DBFA02|nr:helix-turn-helix transcriptional regulator [Paeniclostridium sordellii]CEN26592.1 Helix-turn-helix domain [[Clostridium] sordellii] [Paeniclostridium sordellii]CEP50429.1 Helix-turn-helix domain [[Clostridium] sordellii] [Paeniclostridium sordellii]
MYIRWNYIFDEMKAKKITNTRMAELLEVNRDTWNKWKSEKTDITLKKFMKLLKILNLRFDDVIKDTELSNNNINRSTTTLSDNVNKLLELNKDKPKITTKLNTDRIKNK